MSTSMPPTRPSSQIGPVRLAMVAGAVALIILSWWGVMSAGRGLMSRELTGEGGTPLRFIVPEGADDAPGVIIAHGFSGSRPLMLGFGYALARAGYGVMLLDFDGHGSASGRLSADGSSLQRNLDAAYTALLAQPEIDPTRVALLGHSMGSGAVMSAGIRDVDRYRATVGVSPTGADVTPDAPRNLLLMAGSLEPNFVSNANGLLARAGGRNDDLSAGLGREMVIIPTVEHITILFSNRSHQTALDWLNRTFDKPPATAAPDQRALWYAAHIGGWLLLLVALAPLFPAARPLPAARRRPWWWLGLPAGALAAVAAVALLGRLTDASRLGGLLVGGALAVWFLTLGLVWLLTGFRIPRPTGRDMVWGVALFVVLSLAFGLMAGRVWLPWALIPERLMRWPLMAAAALPWLLAAGLAQHGAPAGRRVVWWLFQSAVIVAGLGLSVAVSPALFFIVLLMPVIPLILALMSIAGATIDRPWSFALGNALFFGWLLVAVFPLA